MQIEVIGRYRILKYHNWLHELSVGAAAAVRVLKRPNYSNKLSERSSHFTSTLRLQYHVSVFSVSYEKLQGELIFIELEKFEL